MAERSEAFSPTSSGCTESGASRPRLGRAIQVDHQLLVNDIQFQQMRIFKYLGFPFTEDGRI